MSGGQNKDFRESRQMLPPDAFAWGPKTNPSPSDLIDQETWYSMMCLPDDVSLRTSGQYGSILKVDWTAWGDWIGIALALQSVSNSAPDSPISHCATNVIDEIEGSIYNALTGFYRLSFSYLRNILEQITIGLYLEVTKNQTAYREWQNGDLELKFGTAVDNLGRIALIAQLERSLSADTGDSLFKRASPTNTAGLGRRLFKELSQYTHGGPGFTNTNLWEGSNGPIFVPKSFGKWYYTFLKVYSLAVIEVKLARPTISTLGGGEKKTVKDVLKSMVDRIPTNSDGKTIFQDIESMNLL